MTTINDRTKETLKDLIRTIDLEESKDDYEDIDADYVEECKDAIIRILREEVLV